MIIKQSFFRFPLTMINYNDKITHLCYIYLKLEVSLNFTTSLRHFKNTNRVLFYFHSLRRGAYLPDKSSRECLLNLAANKISQWTD